MLFGFGTEKSDIIHMFEDAYQVCNGKNLPIQNVTMDNGGENLAIVTFCKHNNIGFKLTPPDTPKLNGVIEHGFAVRLEKAKVLMKNTNLNTTSQSNKIILMEAIKTAAFLYDEYPQKNKIKSPNELWYGSDYKQRVKPQQYISHGFQLVKVVVGNPMYHVTVVVFFSFFLLNMELVYRTGVLLSLYHQHLCLHSVFRFH